MRENVLSTWTQEDLAVYRALGDWEKLWEATIPLVKMQYGRMVRAGTVPEPESKGDDHWLQEMLLIAGEAMRRWDPEKGAYSTFIVNAVQLAIRNSLKREGRCGVTADHGVEVVVLSVEDTRPGTVPDDDAADDDGTFSAALSYGGVVERTCQPQGDVPEGLGDPADEAARMELQGHLAAALACLSPEEREALLAVQVETQAAYAARIGAPRRTVEDRIARAKARVVEILESKVN